MVDTQPLANSTPVNFLLDHWFLLQPLHGIAFGTLVLLGAQSGRVSSWLSWRPLVLLGVASYSVYLMQQPVIEFTERYLPVLPRDSLLRAFLAVVAALIGGGFLYLAVERHFTSRAMRERVLPRLTRAVTWADRLYPHGRSRPAPRPSYPAPSPLDSSI